MANGQQLSQQNVDAFRVWVATQSDDDYRQIIFRGRLNRKEIAKAIGCGKSALNQNPTLKKCLDNLEDELRQRKVLPELSEPSTDKPISPKKYDSNTNSNIFNSKRLSTLESENIELKARINELERELERFGELSDIIYEMGIMPR